MSDPFVIAPVGEVDIAVVPALREELEQAAADPSRPVVVDLSDVGFIDSTGLGAILELHRRLLREDRAPAVVAPHGSAAAVLLDLTKLRGHLRVFDSRRAALDAA